MSMFVYGMLFTALMIAFDGPITFETLFVPGILLYAVVRLTEYAAMKKTKTPPRWLVLGSFGIAVSAAVGMTIWLV
ncbi:hypothetical protein GKZ89_16285 [Bacillus mangrovi]|uniref:Uncharacterized protein n=2 Tax=Metabacillus mangrovi TaxID=1491830 RepID=A0A7X2S7A1_9BACI|nr:hypothetical protein [Metabacillus mangrovi]